MAETRPTGEQISFRSSKTGTHVLDTYMENVEQGTRTLADMIEDIFDSTGTFRAGNFEFRFNATDSEIEFRVGNFANPNSGWTDITSFFDIKGTFSASTTYNNFDVVTLTNKDVYIVHGLSSGQTFADEAALIASSNTTKLVDVSEARDWASKTTGQVASTDYSAKAYAIGGTGLDSGDGSAKDWAIKTSSTVGNTGEYSAKYWATSTNVTTVANGIANINTVAGAITNVNTVASDITNVNTVAGISSDVTDVAAIDSNVTTVAANDANITTVAGVSTNVTTVAGISANVTTVAGISGNVTTVANNNTDISTVATNVADIQTVADEIDNNNLQTVANDIAAVRTAADDLNEATSEIETVANSITNVDAVGGDIANVNTVANDITNVNTSATNVANINTVAGISANVTTVAGISSNITTVAGISSDVTTAANNSSNITTVAGISSNVTTVAGIASDVTTAATNVTAFNQLYLGAQGTAPTQDPDGTALDVGDLYFDTASDTLKVYASGGWVNAGSAVNGTADRFVYTATANQTTFSGADDASNTLAYDAGYLDVYMNGVKLRNGASHDFTATNGTSIVLASGAAANDTIEIIAYGTFTLSNQSIDDMTDVTTSGVADGSFLEYDNANSRFAVSSTINADANGLHVSGDLDIDDSTPVIRMQESDTTDQSTMIRNVGGDFIIGQLYSNGNPGFNRLAVDQATGDIKLYQSNGNVGAHWDAADAALGIGTTTPAGQFHLVGSDTTDQVIIENTDGGAAAAPDLVLWKNSPSPADNDALGQIFFRGENSSGTATNYAAIDAVSADVTAGTEDGKLRFQTRVAGAIADRVVIDGQDLGIGTDSPSRAIDIVRDDNFEAQVRVKRTTNGSGISFGFAQSSMGLFSVTNDDIFLGTGGRQEVTIQNGGAVGIGTSSITSNFKLEVAGDARFGDAYNDDAVELGWSAGSSLGFVQAYDRGATAFRDLQLNNAVIITSGGNVGIGVSSPDDTLTVGSETLTYGSALGGMALGVRAGVLGGTAGNENDIAYFASESTNNNTFGLALKSYRATTGNDWTTTGLKYQFNVDNSIVYDNLLTFNQWRIGMGTDTPDTALHVAASSGNAVMTLNRTNTNTTGRVGGINFTASDDHSVASIQAIGDGNNEGAYLAFSTTSAANSAIPVDTRDLLIRSDGTVCLYDSAGGTGTFSAPRLHIDCDDIKNGIVVERLPQNYTAYGAQMYDNTGTVYHSYMVNASGTNVGSIAMTANGTFYYTTSDRRLKTDIQPISDATEKLMAMNAVTHRWVADPEDDPVHGFIAQEMREIVPEAVLGSPEGDNMMGMDYGRITPVLVAALQDAVKEIAALKERVAELETR